MSTEAAFRQFHSDNPHVLTELERLTARWFDSGKKAIGVKFLFEIIRWNQSVQTDSVDEFKINNNFAPHYARMMVARNPEWDKRIRMRALRSA